MAVFGFDKESGEMTLDSLRPGVTVEQVQSEVSWPLKVAKNLKIAELPTAEELRIIRQDLDPQGIVNQ